jgi:hypothetical protein
MTETNQQEDIGSSEGKLPSEQGKGTKKRRKNEQA